MPQLLQFYYFLSQAIREKNVVPNDRPKKRAQKTFTMVGEIEEEGSGEGRE